MYVSPCSAVGWRPCPAGRPEWLSDSISPHRASPFPPNEKETESIKITERMPLHRRDRTRSKHPSQEHAICACVHTKFTSFNRYPRRLLWLTVISLAAYLVYHFGLKQGQLRLGRISFGLIQRRLRPESHESRVFVSFIIVEHS